MDANITDSIHYVRGATKFLKGIRETLEKFIDEMPLPEGTEPIQRANIKLWLNHYMDGNCSYESLKNILKYWGFDDLLKPPIHEMEVSEDGKLKIYDVT